MLQTETFAIMGEGGGWAVVQFWPLCHMPWGCGDWTIWFCHFLAPRLMSASPRSAGLLQLRPSSSSCTEQRGLVLVGPRSSKALHGAFTTKRRSSVDAPRMMAEGNSLGDSVAAAPEVFFPMCPPSSFTLPSLQSFRLGRKCFLRALPGLTTDAVPGLQDCARQGNARPRRHDADSRPGGVDCRRGWRAEGGETETNCPRLCHTPPHISCLLGRPHPCLFLPSLPLSPSPPSSSAFAVWQTLKRPRANRPFISSP